VYANRTGGVPMPDVTVRVIDEMDPIYDGVARRARA
jgi:hypothetical protein